MYPYLRLPTKEMCQSSNGQPGNGRRSSTFTKVSVTIHIIHGVVQSVGHLTGKSEVLGTIIDLATYFSFSFG